MRIEQTEHNLTMLTDFYELTMANGFFDFFAHSTRSAAESSDTPHSSTCYAEGILPIS